MLAPRGAIAQDGDMVILFRGHLSATPLLLQRGAVLHCKEGKFRHDDIIGRPLGTRVEGQSNAKRDPTRPRVLVLQHSASLWTRAVPHRTQIVYDTDAAVVVFGLRLRPGLRVAEAGTGSGALTHALARAVAPGGAVFTGDFHRGRVAEARGEIRRSGVKEALVTCSWRDVCAEGRDAEVEAAGEEGEREREGEEPKRGFGLGRHAVDAVFLDVPAPWLAIENVLHVLRPGGMLCTFSPCIEQTQRTAQRLRQEPFEFMDIRTVEALTKQFKPVYKRDRDGNTQFKLRPAPVSKGHSAYLTFARRRLERLEEPVAEENAIAEEEEEEEEEVEGKEKIEE